MPLTRAMVLSFALLTLTAPMVRAQDAGDLIGDPQRGKIVFRSSGSCVNCHGWAADGKTGVNLRSPTGSNLRESTLDDAGLIEVITCGRPGTAMPYHGRTAYRDDSCYGNVGSDFAPGSAPVRGKALAERDIANLAAYLRAQVIGLAAPTYEECASFFDNPDAQACRNLK